MLAEKAPAKINWFLSIIGKRGDGFHEIVSTMQRVDLYDDLFFEEAEGIELDSDLGIPPDKNLVYRAAIRLKQHVAYPGGARIRLVKRIPAAAGLGGGSSDAAAALRGLNALWGLGLDRTELMHLGAGIGSDVPFFLGPPLALVEGRGERVSPLGKGRAFTLLLVKPSVAVSTAWAYQSFSPELTKDIADIKLFCRALAEGDYEILRPFVTNDLEKVVSRRYPVIDEIKGSLLRHGAAISSMSGSGSTVFGVFEGSDTAERAAAYFGEHWCRAVRTLAEDGAGG